MFTQKQTIIHEPKSSIDVRTAELSIFEVTALFNLCPSFGEKIIEPPTDFAIFK